MALFFEEPWDSQPQERVEIALPFDSLILPSLRADIVRGVPIESGGSAGVFTTIGPGPMGGMAILNPAVFNGATIVAADSSTLLSTTESTILYAGPMRATAGSSGDITTADSSAAFRCMVTMGLFGTTTFWDFGGTGANQRVSYNWGTYASEDRDIWGFTAGPRGLEIWRNGIRYAHSTSPATGRTATTSAFTINGKVSNSADADCYLFGYSRKQFPAETMQRITRSHAEMYGAVFQPQSIPVPVSAGGGGTSVSGNLGTATASGFTGGVNANRTIAGSLGTASASGFTGGVFNGTDTTVAGNLGTATASGFTGGVNANRTIPGTLGTSVASGFQGTVSNTNDTVVNGNLGTAVASGLVGGVSWNRIVAGTVGVAVASGYAGTVTNGDVPEPEAPVQETFYAPKKKRDYKYDFSPAPVVDTPMAAALSKAIEVKAEKSGKRREEIEQTLRKVTDLGAAQEAITRQIEAEARDIEAQRFAGEMQRLQDAEDAEIAQVLAMLL